MMIHPMMGRGAPYTPDSEPGVVAWWDSVEPARMSVAAGALVSWTDRVGGLVLTPVSAGSNHVGPAESLGGANAVNIPNGKYISAAATPAALALDPNVDEIWMMVCGQVAGNNNSGFGPAMLTVGGLGLGLVGPSSVVPAPNVPQMEFGGSFKADGPAEITGFNGWILGGRISASVGAELYVNGSLVTPTPQSTLSTALLTSKEVAIGRRDASAEYIDGLVGDCIVAKNLSVGHRQRIEGYLAWKFGLAGALPSGHPYRTSPP